LIAGPETKLPIGPAARKLLSQMERGWIGRSALPAGRMQHR
jgi:hypothetical protein